MTQHPEKIPDNAEETLDARDALLDAFSAWGCTMMYCSNEGWPEFKQWMISVDEGSQHTEKDSLETAVRILRVFLEEVETELFIAKQEEFLAGMDAAQE